MLASLIAGLILATGLYASDTLYRDGFESGQGGNVGGPCDTQLAGYQRVHPARYSTGAGYRAAFTYADLLGEWGAFSNDRRNPVMGSFQYISLPFTIGTDRPDDRARLIWEQLIASPDNIRLSVSTCYGAPMAETAVSAECYLQGSGRSGKFSMWAVPAAFGCQLKSGRLYYLNLAFADAAGGSGCSRLLCEFLVVQQ